MKETLLMSETLLNWFVNRLNRDLTGEMRKRFLRTLKEDETALVVPIEEFLFRAELVACAEMRQGIFINDFGSASRKVIQRLKENLASELANV